MGPHSLAAENVTPRPLMPPAPAEFQRPDPAMPDLGIIASLMADERVHDILISGTQPIYVDMGGQLYDSGLRYTNHSDVWALAETITKSVGQKWHDDRPMIDTRLPDGTRVNIVAPPMAVDGVTISIRKFPANNVTLDDMVRNGQLPQEYADFFRICATKRLNIIVSGGTSSGKTTLLSTLAAAISPRERIVTIEDSAELRLPLPHVVRLESKDAISLDAPHTAVTIRDLVKNALRMRPDRILVGESRGPEALDVLQAMNTGHDGSMTTLHANSPREALSRLETMISSGTAQLTSKLIRQQIASTIHLIIQMNRTREGVRRILQVSELAGMEGEVIVMQDLLVYQEGQQNGTAGGYRWVAGAPRNPLVAEAARDAGLIRTLR